MKTREKGKEKEKIAEKYLKKKKKYKILDRNYTKRTGEIDIIAKDNKTIVFVEVRSLESKDIDPLETVSFKKRERIIKTAKLYLMEHPEFDDMDVRFDFVGVRGEDITHIENVFWEEV